MCRGKDHGGRRCPNDGAVARRNRRQNVKKKAEYEGYTITGITPDVDDLDSSSSVESIINKARSILADYNDIQKRIGPAPVIPLWHSKELTADEILAEQKLIKLGDTVEELAVKYGCPSDEEFELENNWINNDKVELEQQMSNNDDVFFEDHEISIGYDEELGGAYFMKSNHNTTNDIDEYIDQSKYRNDEPSKLDKIRSDFSIYKAEQEELQSQINIHTNNFKNMLEQRSKVYRQALKEIGVEFAKAEDLEIDSTEPEAIAFVQKQAELYPKSWVENSNKMDKRLSVISQTGVRASYNPTEALITYCQVFDKNNDMAHELGHRMEHSNPSVVEAERLFLNRRAGFVDYHSGNRKNEPEIASIDGIPWEIGYPEAGFAENYTSRIYDFANEGETLESRKEYIAKNGSQKGYGLYEVLTNGVESTFFGEHGGGLGFDGMRKDPEHTRFILGLLASTAK